MHRPAGLALLFALVIALVAAAPVGAQDAPVHLQVHPTERSVRVVFQDLFSGGGLPEALSSGLPVRIHIVTELWRDGVVDALERRSEWRATVILDPLGNRYRVEAGPADPGEGSTTQEVTTDLAAIDRILERTLRIPIRPGRSGTYYYLARLELETLAPSDLDDLSRWLRGDLGPAVEGGGIAGAVGRGLRRLLVGILGLPVQRFEVRSERFEVP